MSMESGALSSRRISRSISRGSSGIGNGSRRQSLPATYGVPAGLSVPELELDASEKAENPPKVQLRRLAYLNKPEIPVLLAGTVAGVVNGAIMPIFGILISSVIRTFYETPHIMRRDSRFWALMFTVLGLASLIAYPARTYFFGVAGNKLIRRIRLICFEKVVRMEVGWFDNTEHSSGVIGAKLSGDAATVRALVGDSLAQMVQDVSAATVGLVIAFQASWQLSLIILVLLPLIALSGYAQIKFMKGFSADAKVRE